MNRVRAQLLIFGVIAVLIIAYASFDLLGVKVVGGPFPVTVQLNTGGGIFTGAEVAFRGVQVGTVKDARLGRDGVTLTMSIDRGTRIPADVRASVADLSVVGEQYVDLVPSGHADGGDLHAGSVIPADQTSTPLQNATVLYDLERFLNSIHPGDLGVLSTQGAAAFGGAGPALHQLLSDMSDVIQQMYSARGNISQLLGNSDLLLQGAAAHAGDFDNFATSLRQLTTTLATYAPQMKRLIQQSAPAAELTTKFIQQNGTAMGVLLGNLATFADIQVARVPGLKALLIAVPEFGELAPKLATNGALNSELLINQSSPVCTTGVPFTSPLSGIRTPVAHVNCPGNLLARGAEQAPSPASGTAAYAPAAGPAQPTAGNSAQVTAYSAGNSQVTSSNGTTAQLGTNGGEQEFLGSNSWQELLLAAS